MLGPELRTNGPQGVLLHALLIGRERATDESRGIDGRTVSEKMRETGGNHDDNGRSTFGSEGAYGSVRFTTLIGESWFAPFR